MSYADATELEVAVQALVMLVRDEWPSDYSLEEIAEGRLCSDEQVEAIRRLVAGELSLRIVDQPFHVVEIQAG